MTERLRPKWLKRNGFAGSPRAAICIPQEPLIATAYSIPSRIAWASPAAHLTRLKSTKTGLPGEPARQE